MICETCPSIAGAVFAAALTGFVFGVAYFVALRRTVSLFVANGGWWELSALTLGRLVAITVFFTFAARLGAAPLLAAFLGFLLARAATVRFVGSRE
jgi:hypothetical protein